MSIDLNVLRKIQGAPNFTWHEAIWCPQWAVHILPEGVIRKNIVEVAAKMEMVRKIFNKPIIVHSWLRPPAYNKLIGGSPSSPHCEGKAVDFHVHGMDCNDAREKILPHLESFQIRMEDIDANWIHIDIREVGTSRFFKP